RRKDEPALPHVMIRASAVASAPAVAEDAPPAPDADLELPPSVQAKQSQVQTLKPPKTSVRPQLNQPVSVPVSSLLTAGGALILMVITAFFVGRSSAANAQRLKVRTVFNKLPALARAALPEAPKPCWVSRQPVMWAPKASKSIPFELLATSNGTLAIGYAQSD